MSESKKEGLDIHESILYYWLTKIKYVYVYWYKYSSPIQNFINSYS